MSKEAQTKQEHHTKSEDKAAGPEIQVQQQFRLVKQDQTDCKDEVRVMKRINRSLDMPNKGRDLTETEPSHLEKAIPLQRYRRSGKSNECQRKEPKRPPRPNVPKVTFLEDLKSVSSLPERSGSQHHARLRDHHSPSNPRLNAPHSTPVNATNILVANPKLKDEPEFEPTKIPEKDRNVSQASLGPHRPSEPAQKQHSPPNFPQAGPLLVKHPPSSLEGSWALGEQVNTKQETGSLSRPTHKPSDPGESTPVAGWVTGPGQPLKQLQSMTVDKNKPVFRPQFSAPLPTTSTVVEETEEQIFFAKVKEMLTRFPEYALACQKLSERMGLLEKRVDEGSRLHHKTENRLNKIEVANRILQEFQRKFESRVHNTSIIPEAETVIKTQELPPESIAANPEPISNQDIEAKTAVKQNDEEPKQEEHTVAKLCLVGEAQVQQQEPISYAEIAQVGTNEVVSTAQPKNEEQSLEGAKLHLADILAEKDRVNQQQPEETHQFSELLAKQDLVQEDVLDVNLLVQTRSRVKRGSKCQATAPGQMQTEDSTKLRTGDPLLVGLSNKAQMEIPEIPAAEEETKQEVDKEMTASGVLGGEPLGMSPLANSKQLSEDKSSRSKFRRTGEKNKSVHTGRLGQSGQKGRNPSPLPVKQDVLIQLKKKLDKTLQDRLNEQLAKICESQSRVKRTQNKKSGELKEEMLGKRGAEGECSDRGVKEDGPKDAPVAQQPMPSNCEVILGPAVQKTPSSAGPKLPPRRTRRSTSLGDSNPKQKEEKSGAVAEEEGKVAGQGHTGPVTSETQDNQANAVVVQSSVGGQEYQRPQTREQLVDGQSPLSQAKSRGRSGVVMERKAVRASASKSIFTRNRNGASEQDSSDMREPEASRAVAFDSLESEEYQVNPRDGSRAEYSTRQRSRSHSKRKRRAKRRSQKHRRPKFDGRTGYDRDEDSSERVPKMLVVDPSYHKSEHSFRKRIRNGEESDRYEQLGAGYHELHGRLSRRGHRYLEPHREEYVEVNPRSYYPHQFDSQSELESDERNLFGLHMSGFERVFAEDRVESTRDHSRYVSKPEASVRSQIRGELESSSSEQLDKRRRSTSKKTQKSRKRGQNKY